MYNENKLKDTYNRIAKDWHSDHQEDDWWVEGTDKFISMLEPGDRVLDLGCGAGTKTKYLVKKNLSVLGIDFAETMIEIAKEEVPNAEFNVLSLYKVNDLDEQFDGIFMQAVLLHVPKVDAGEVIKKVTTKIKNDGLLYIAVKERWEGSAEEEVKMENDYGYEYKRFFSYYSIKEIKKYFEDAGLEVIFESVAPAGNTNWVQIIGRK